MAIRKNLREHFGHLMLQLMGFNIFILYFVLTIQVFNNVLKIYMWITYFNYNAYNIF